MFLAMDVGNTCIKVGLYQSTRPDADLTCNWRLSTDAERTGDEYGALFGQMLRDRGLRPGDITRVAICTVVPGVVRALREFCGRCLKTEPFFADASLSTMKVSYERPCDLGPDRLCNAIAAYSLVQGPTVVIDFGTATKLEAVSGAGEYLGGAILPGIGISWEALYGRTARLHPVEFAAPPSVIGSSTTTALQSGLVFGSAGQADAMIERVKDALDPVARVVATGGFAPLLEPLCTHIDLHVEHLTLDGLRRMYAPHAAGA